MKLTTTFFFNTKPILHSCVHTLFCASALLRHVKQTIDMWLLAQQTQAVHHASRPHRHPLVPSPPPALQLQQECVCVPVCVRLRMCVTTHGLCRPRIRGLKLTQTFFSTT